MARFFVILLVVLAVLVPPGVCVCQFAHHENDASHTAGGPDGGLPCDGSHDGQPTHDSDCPALNAMDRTAAAVPPVDVPTPDAVLNGLVVAVGVVPSHVPVVGSRPPDRPAYITFRALLI